MTLNIQTAKQLLQSTIKGKRKIKHILFITYTFFFWSLLLFLLIMYLFVGDRTSFGEFITIWPPLLWIFGLIPMSLVFFLLRRYYYCLLAIIGIGVFLIFTEEWHTLFRFSHDGSKTVYSTPQPNQPGSGKTRLRIIVWNIDNTSSKKVLTILETYKPDVCCLQEIPKLELSASDSAGYWKGFSYIGSGDCGTLSRYPVREMVSKPVGPWAAPQMLMMDLPDHRQVLLVDVRLMLPTLLFNICSYPRAKPVALAPSALKIKLRLTIHPRALPVELCPSGY